VLVIIDGIDGLAGNFVDDSRVVHRTFLCPPSVIPAPFVIRRFEVDFFPRVLPDVGDPKVAVLPVETTPPGITQSKIPDLWSAAPAEKGIASWDGIVRAAGGLVDINAENFPEEGIFVLGVVVLRIIAGTPVARGDLEKAVVWPEAYPAAVVVAEGLREGKDEQLAGGVGNIRVSGRNAIAADLCVTGQRW